MAEGPLFLNTPISSKAQDAVGVDLFVDKLNTAIDEGAQMIAIASPFGAGKSSVVEVLQHTRKKRPWYKRWERKDKFVEVSMWSHLSNEGAKEATAELHKNFIYQMASQIKPRKGTYISRRLSHNYGLLRLHANRRINWFFTIMALLMFVVQWFLTKYSETAVSWIPWLKGKTEWIAAAMMFGAIIIAIVVLTTTDVIFSSNRSEGARTIDGDEIMDIYRTELLKPRHSRFCLWKKLRPGTRYIVIIEDLDRTDAPETVLSFLKELRKYYVPEKDVATMYVNQASFIVTIKPESLLATEIDVEAGKEKKAEDLLQGKEKDEAHRENENTEDAKIQRESLYAKIFDYTLNLQTINIANYDAILHELLDEHRDELKALGAFEGADIEHEENLASLPGMKWIIREHRLGVREIKERLNIAFTLFETLQKRFPEGSISFEKCAAAAYLTTAFEKDFYATDHMAFRSLVDCYLHLNQRDEKAFADVSDKFAENLARTSKDYQRAVWDLIRSKQIDVSYRMYYYNYPRASHFYTADESLVNFAITYGEPVDGLEEAAQAVETAHSKVVGESYQELRRLGLPLPMFVFEIEPLYVEAVRYNFDELLKRMTNFDYSAEGAQKTVERFQRILGFDWTRSAYHEGHAKSFCELWEKQMSEPVLLQLRLMLCQAFSREIHWYSSLFRGSHNIISVVELNALPFCRVLELTDQANIDFSEKEVEYVIQRYAKVDPQERNRLQKQTEEFLRQAVKILGVAKTVLALVEFMKTNGEIVDDFEENVCGYIKSANVEDEEDDEERKLAESGDKSPANSEEVFSAYQQLINQVAPKGLSEETIQRLRKLDRYGGYSLETALCLKENGYVYEYVLFSLCQNAEIPYEEPDIMQTILENGTQLYVKDQKLFLSLREDILESNPKLINQYRALFGKDHPIITEREIKAVEGEGRDIDSQILDLILPSKVTESTIGYLRDFFCRCKHKNETSLKILCFIGEMKSKTANKLFYSLDFDIIAYRHFAKGQQKKAKAQLAEVLELSAPANKINFMAATKCLDAEWESELETEMKGNRELEKAYVAAVNSCEKISTRTVAIVTKLSEIYGTAPHVTDKVRQEKKYFWYVTSKIRWEKKFAMEEGELGEVLWNTYVEIFGKERDDTWKPVKDCMERNTQFLYKLMEKKEYAKLDNNSRMSMARLQQDEDSVAEAFSRGDEFALKYFLKVDGFRDWNAANRFIELISENATLLASNELYECIHEKLIDKYLKAKYTNRRKK